MQPFNNEQNPTGILNKKHSVTVQNLKKKVSVIGDGKNNSNPNNSGKDPSLTSVLDCKFSDALKRLTQKSALNLSLFVSFQITGIVQRIIWHREPSTTVDDIDHISFLFYRNMVVIQCIETMQLCTLILPFGEEIYWRRSMKEGQVHRFNALKFVRTTYLTPDSNLSSFMNLFTNSDSDKQKQQQIIDNGISQQLEEPTTTKTSLLLSNTKFTPIFEFRLQLDSDCEQLENFLNDESQFNTESQLNQALATMPKSKWYHPPILTTVNEILEISTSLTSTSSHNIIRTSLIASIIYIHVNPAVSTKSLGAKAGHHSAPM